MDASCSTSVGGMKTAGLSHHVTPVVNCMNIKIICNLWLHIPLERDPSDANDVVHA